MQQQDFQLRLATVSTTNMPAETTSQGYLRVDAYLTAGSGYGRYFGLNFPVSIKINQHLQLDQGAAFFRGSEEILALNSRSGNNHFVDYDRQRSGDDGPISKDYLFPGDFNADLFDLNADTSTFPNANYDHESDSSAVVRLTGAQMQRVWKRDKIAELVETIKEDVGALGYKLQPIRIGEQIFEKALSGFPSDFQEAALKARCFNFQRENFQRKVKVAAGKTPYIRFVSVPMGGQPR